MDSNCRKLGETPYRECRKQAAIYNDALILDDVIRWRFFGEEKPHYHLFKKGHHRK